MSAAPTFVFGEAQFGVAAFGVGAVDVSSAIQALLEAGLIPFVYYAASATVPAGYVISQVPAGGTLVRVNTQVIITVSDGPGGVQGSVTVPDFSGLYWKAATDALQAAFLSNDKYLWRVSAAPQGTVIAQSAASGTNVSAGTKVQLTLSAGATIVPATVSVPEVV